MNADEKSRKSLVNTAKSVEAIGYIIIIVNVGLYVASIFGFNPLQFSLPQGDLTSVITLVTGGLVFIILGRRLRNTDDKNSKTNLIIILVLSVLLLGLIVWSGGRVGILFILMMIYLVSSLVTLNKLLKSEEYKASLKDYDYKLGVNGWRNFFAIAVILFMASFWANPHINAIITHNVIKNAPSKEVYIQQIVDQAKKTMKLPEKLDEYTILTGLTAGTSSVNYKYSIENHAIKDFDTEIIKKNVITSVCERPDSRELINDGINLNYNYTFEKTQENFQFEVSEKDC